MASPLEGVSVVDLSRGMAGAIATMLLADYGASVLQVGHPRGDPFQTLPAMHVWNRGKKSITLDLGRPQAKGVLFRLLDTADVLLETFQPGYLARLGLDYPSLRERYPRLVYCSLTGYGQEGPERDRPAYDGLVQARAGLQGQRWGAQGGHRTGPLYMAFAAPSYAGGFLACVGILTALHVRELTGLGQQVDTSLADASRAMSRWSWAERVPPSATRGPARSMVRVFRCADGEHLWAHTGARGAFERLMKALGMEEFVGSEETNRMGKPMTAEAAKRMVEKAEQVFASRPRAEWMRLLEEADVPNRPVLRPGECFADEQVQAIDMVVSVEDPGLGPLRQVGLPLKFAQTPGHIRGPAPLPGQHNDEVLARLGYSQEERAAFRRQGVV